MLKMYRKSAFHHFFRPPFQQFKILIGQLKSSAQGSQIEVLVLFIRSKIYNTGNIVCKIRIIIVLHIFDLFLLLGLDGIKNVLVYILDHRVLR